MSFQLPPPPDTSTLSGNQAKLRKIKLTLFLSITIAGLIFTPLYAWYYIVSILSSPEGYDAYAMNWQFQLMMFCLFRLPIILVVWFVIIFLILALPWRIPHRSE